MQVLEPEPVLEPVLEREQVRVLERVLELELVPVLERELRTQPGC